MAAAQEKIEFSAWFECAASCGGRWSLTDVIYRCPKCSGLLTVVHDREALAKRSAAGWKDLLVSRAHTTEWPHGSGVWGKRELVCPGVSDDNVVSMYEGHSNLFWARRYGRQLGLEDLWLKLCGNTHTGSFKDLGMTVLVSVVQQMRSDGQDIPAVACASSGDTSAALAAYAAYAERASSPFRSIPSATHRRPFAPTQRRTAWTSRAGRSSPAPPMKLARRWAATASAACAARTERSITSWRRS